MGFLFVFSEIKKETSEKNLRFAFYVLILGLIADLGLFFLSVGVIKELCGLCVATYVITIALLAVNFPIFKSLSDKSIRAVLNSFSGSFVNFLIVILSFSSSVFMEEEFPRVELDWFPAVQMVKNPFPSS